MSSAVEPSALEGWPNFVRPTLSVLRDGQTWRTADLFNAIADEMQLTEAQRSERLNSGQARAFNRMGWALSHLTRARAVKKVRNGYSVITDLGRRLLEENPRHISEEILAAIPEYQDYEPKVRRVESTPAAEEGPAFWLVGAYFNSSEDRSSEFVAQGIWRNGNASRYVDDVNAMQPGERIAIKAAYVRKHDLPFDNKGNPVSVMGIKATGAITRNHGDGQTVDVDWDPQEDIREWYFFTNQRTVWKVLPGDWKTDALIAFAFDGADQDIDVFRNADYWRPRFGDDAEPPRIDTQDGDDNDADPPGPTPETDSYSIADVVADGCFIPESVLQEYLSALGAKKNLILQGPPGTGKTWLAKRLGYALIGEKNRDYLRALQFHPSTSYEDFVRGWRPSADGRLVLADGTFLDLVASAQADPGHNYVLVIEEINRGNLAQIFGELLTLLEAEKRAPSEAIDLTYSKDGESPLYLPENLYIIGTMNLADRSLAIVDFALRRRFAFAELEPMFNDAWRRWVAENNGITDDELRGIASRVNEVNALIATDRSLGRQYQIGHSFFTPPAKRKVNASEWSQRVVLRELRPLLAEYWFDEPDRVDRAVDQLLGESP